MQELVKFEADLVAERDTLARLLPTHVSFEDLKVGLQVGIQQSPEILRADRLSVMIAVRQAAEDGLKPDGREGFLNIYNEKREIGGREQWVKVAKWHPMVEGIRKQAARHGIIIESDIVCEMDKCDITLGSHPCVVHKPHLGGERGKWIGVYASFNVNGHCVHVEWMEPSEVAKVQACSKAKNSLLWTKFTSRAWVKSAVRRGAKSVPTLPVEVKRAIERGDDDYVFDGLAAVLPAPPTSAPKQIAAAMPPSIAEVAARTGEPAKEVDGDAGQAVEAPQEPGPEKAPAEPLLKKLSDDDKAKAFVAELDKRLGRATTDERLNEVWAANEKAIESKLWGEHRNAAYALWDRHEARIKGKAAA